MDLMLGSICLSTGCAVGDNPLLAGLHVGVGISSPRHLHFHSSCIPTHSDWCIILLDRTRLVVGGSWLGVKNCTRHIAMDKSTLLAPSL